MTLTAPAPPPVVHAPLWRIDTRRTQIACSCGWSAHADRPHASTAVDMAARLARHLEEGRP